MDFLDYLKDEDLSDNLSELYFGLGEDRENFVGLIEIILADIENVDNVYNILLLQAITSSDRKIIKEVIADNNMNNKILKDIYNTLGAKSRYSSNLYNLDTPDTNYILNLENAIFIKFEYIETYKRLYMKLKDHEDNMSKILFNELKNLNKLTMLYAKNK